MGLKMREDILFSNSGVEVALHSSKPTSVLTSVFLFNIFLLNRERGRNRRRGRARERGRDRGRGWNRESQKQQ